jgi:hypothetical protein
VREGRVGRINPHLGEKRRHRATGQPVSDRLLEQVTDHALRLGPQHVQRVRLDLGVGLRLQRQQADLGSVAMGDDELVLSCQLGQRLGRQGDVDLLGAGLGSLPSAEQRVPTEGDDDPHREPQLPVTRA